MWNVRSVFFPQDDYMKPWNVRTTFVNDALNNTSQWTLRAVTNNKKLQTLCTVQKIPAEWTPVAVARARCVANDIEAAPVALMVVAVHYLKYLQ